LGSILININLNNSSILKLTEQIIFKNNINEQSKNNFTFFSFRTTEISEVFGY